MARRVFVYKRYFSQSYLPTTKERDKRAYDLYLNTGSPTQAARELGVGPSVVRLRIARYTHWEGI